MKRNKRTHSSNIREVWYGLLQLQWEWLILLSMTWTFCYKVVVFSLYLQYSVECCVTFLMVLDQICKAANNSKEMRSNL